LLARYDPRTPSKELVMRRALPLLILMSLAFAPAPQPRAKPDTTAADLKRLQGVWLRVSSPIDVRSVATSEVTVSIEGRKMSFAFDGRPTRSWSFTLDGRPTLPCLDQGEAGFPANGILRGIYRLDGDTLTLNSRRGGRPDNFSGNGEGVIVEVFKRKKP
jgi:uncharacterized protein (TIGR03067 family)